MDYNRLLISILCLLGAAWFGSQYYFQKEDAASSKEWYCVTGKMQINTMEKTERYSRGRHYVLYTPHVSYSYNYKNQHYRGNVVSFPDPQFDNYDQSNSFQRKFAEGSPVTVWFDPKSPARACLIQGEGARVSKDLAFALGLLVAGLLTSPIMSLNKSDEYLDRLPNRSYSNNY